MAVDDSCDVAMDASINIDYPEQDTVDYNTEQVSHTAINVDGGDGPGDGQEQTGGSGGGEGAQQGGEVGVGGTMHRPGVQDMLRKSGKAKYLSGLTPPKGAIKPMSILKDEVMLAQAHAISVLAWLITCLRCAPGKESSIMITDKRIVYRWINTICHCIPSQESEETFSYRDVQFVWVLKGFFYRWLYSGTVFLIVGIILVSAGQSPKDSVLLTIGAILIIIGCLQIIWWILGLFCTGTFLVINYCRPGVRVRDWDGSVLGGDLVGRSTAHRFILLSDEDAHRLMYTILQHPLVYNGRPHTGARIGMV